MPTCETYGAAEQTYRALFDDTLEAVLEDAGLDLDALTTRPDPDLGAPCIALCPRCHPHLDAHPPVGTPPAAWPTQPADYICGRAKRQGERCRSPVGQPWAPCGFHQYASIIPDDDSDLWDTSLPDAPPREVTASRRPAANAAGPPDSWDNVSPVSWDEASDAGTD